MIYTSDNVEWMYNEEILVSCVGYGSWPASALMLILITENKDIN